MCSSQVKLPRRIGTEAVWRAPQTLEPRVDQPSPVGGLVTVAPARLPSVAPPAGGHLMLPFEAGEDAAGSMEELNER